MKNRIVEIAAVTAVLMLGLTGSARSQCGGMMHSGSHSDHAAEKTEQPKVILYPIDYCIVSGEKLGDMGDPVKYEYKDRTVYFCCKGCIKKFEAEPAKYLAVLDAAIAKAAGVPPVSPAKAESRESAGVAADTSLTKSTPKLTTLDWCIVSDEALGGMGKAVTHKYNDREITFCCKGCIKEFEKTPAAYLAKLDSALAGQITRPMEAEDAEDSHGGSGSHH